ncbi:hypothetical protein EIK80_03245 [Caulobacter sp. 602-1]|nr:hypothetical protein EIK80_03245 [Caulobacter sp. 602-1]
MRSQVRTSLHRQVRQNAVKSAADQHRRSFWLKQLHQWHWISAALSLIGMLLFAITGLTLNHAGQIEAKPVVVSRKATLPPDLLALLAKGPEEGKRPLPVALEPFLDRAVGAEVAGREGEWSADEVYVALARPGGDAWVSIDRETGAVEHEKTTRGAISLLNDLHKGRNSGKAWSWFIDIFALACVIFTVTGLILLQFHARARPLTWPLVGLGLVVPVILVILFVHL